MLPGGFAAREERQSLVPAMKEPARLGSQSPGSDSDGADEGRSTEGTEVHLLFQTVSSPAPFGKTGGGARIAVP